MDFLRNLFLSCFPSREDVENDVNSAITIQQQSICDNNEDVKNDENSEIILDDISEENNGKKHLPPNLPSTTITGLSSIENKKNQSAITGKIVGVKNNTNQLATEKKIGSVKMKKLQKKDKVINVDEKNIDFHIDGMSALIDTQDLLLKKTNEELKYYIEKQFQKTEELITRMNDTLNRIWLLRTFFGDKIYRYEKELQEISSPSVEFKKKQEYLESLNKLMGLNLKYQNIDEDIKTCYNRLVGLFKEQRDKYNKFLEDFNTLINNFCLNNPVSCCIVNKYKEDINLMFKKMISFHNTISVNGKECKHIEQLREKYLLELKKITKNYKNNINKTKEELKNEDGIDFVIIDDGIPALLYDDRKQEIEATIKEASEKNQKFKRINNEDIDIDKYKRLIRGDIINNSKCIQKELPAWDKRRPVPFPESDDSVEMSFEDEEENETIKDEEENDTIKNESEYCMKSSNQSKEDKKEVKNKFDNGIKESKSSVDLLKNKFEKIQNGAIIKRPKSCNLLEKN